MQIRNSSEMVEEGVNNFYIDFMLNFKDFILNQIGQLNNIIS